MTLDEMCPGSKLRTAREEKGMTLADVSSITNISAASLKALEEADFEFLPRGIYTRAFIKNYSITLGLKADVILDEFVEKYPDEVGQIIKDDNVNAFATEEHENRQLAARSTLLVAGLVVLCLAVVVYLFFQGGLETSELIESPARETTIASPSSAAAVVRSESRIAATDRDVVVTNNELVIELAPQADCWVSAVVDGVESLSKLMKSGDREIIRFTDRTILNIGDAGVLSLKINNRLARPLGANGEVVTATIDHSNYQTYLLQ
jgi:transcriptional regulator with XRE-family HTH domain